MGREAPRTAARCEERGPEPPLLWAVQQELGGGGARGEKREREGGGGGGGRNKGEKEKGGGVRGRKGKAAVTKEVLAYVVHTHPKQAQCLRKNTGATWMGLNP